MREILFRGKDLDGVWRHGSLVDNVFFYADTKKGVPYIFDVEDVDYSCLADLEDGEGFYELRPKTIGQFTGLTDKNGKRIFEGDILRVKEYENALMNTFSDEPNRFDLFTLEEIKAEYIAEYVSPVVCDEGGFQISSNGEYFDMWCASLFGDMKRSSPIFEFEVIGNIHDNPDIEMHAVKLRYKK